MGFRTEWSESTPTTRWATTSPLVTLRWQSTTWTTPGTTGRKGRPRIAFGAAALSGSASTGDRLSRRVGTGQGLHSDSAGRGSGQPVAADACGEGVSGSPWRCGRGCRAAARRGDRLQGGRLLGPPPPRRAADRRCGCHWAPQSRTPPDARGSRSRSGSAGAPGTHASCGPSAPPVARPTSPAQTGSSAASALLPTVFGGLLYSSGNPCPGTDRVWTVS
jgi:hypothetical protein